VTELVTGPTGIELLDPAQLTQLRGVKWSSHDADVLAAWVADMDLRPPRVVTDALSDLVARGDLGYNFHAIERLPEAFTTWQEEGHGWRPDPASIRVFCDVLHAIDTVVWLHTEPGDGIILLTPVYPPFLAAVHGAGRRLVDVPLDPGGWRLDPERLRAAVDDRTRVILVCNPHNPTGRVFGDDELAAIGQVAVEHDLVVISDEVWADLLHPGAVHRPLATVSDEVAARTVTLSSASKTFNLAGLRCAVAHLGHRRVAESIESLPTHLLGAVGSPGAEATLAAWTAGRPWLADLRAHLTARRDQVAAALAAELPEVGFSPPQATYLAWLDLRPLGLGEDPAARLLSRARVGLSSGTDFGPGGAGWVRLNFATSEQLLDEVLDRIIAVTGRSSEAGRPRSRASRPGEDETVHVTADHGADLVLPRPGADRRLRSGG
jgi:cystathionine beta-lyase